MRSLTEEGIEAFDEYLTELRCGSDTPPPWFLLEDPGMSRSVQGAPDVQRQRFATRRDVGRYLNQVLDPIDAGIREQSQGLWTWLALFHFDQICPANDRGLRKPGKTYRYIPSTHRWYYYRHLLWGPYNIYSLHPGGARCLLFSNADTHGEFSEQLASRQERIVNPGLIELVDLLYWDDSSEKSKAGATSQKLGGSLRRLLKVMDQLELTYDLYAMRAGELMGLLPGEFRRWMPV